MGAMQFQNVGPGPAGGLNSLPSHGMQNMYSHGGVAPFPNNASMRIPHGVPLDPSLSATEAYCQQHEVTATVSVRVLILLKKSYEVTQLALEIWKFDTMESWVASILYCIYRLNLKVLSYYSNR